MNIYHISSIVKFIIGSTILISSLRFIDPWIDPSTSVIITSVWLILMIWWLWFYAFLFIMSFVSDKKYSYLASYAYKLSLLTGSYAAINWLLIWFWIWSRWVGLGLLVLCWLLWATILWIIAPHKPQDQPNE